MQTMRNRTLQRNVLSGWWNSQFIFDVTYFAQNSELIGNLSELDFELKLVEINTLRIFRMTLNTTSLPLTN